ncbi:hypothetical protein HK101_011693 [Irineochytrium annulatum]|nr:hypothetical protein HK101_011693 [Irineochytrium annulatum]
MARVDRQLPSQPVSLVLSFDHARREILTGPPNFEQSRWSIEQHEAHCRSTILTALASTAEHPHRIFYALAGTAFLPDNPRPIGGKRYPGYNRFKGEPEDILPWLLSVSLRPEWETGRRRPPPTSTLLTCVVVAVNDVLGLFFREGIGISCDGGGKGEAGMDGVVLRGMKRSGHISVVGGSQIQVLPSELKSRRAAMAEGEVDQRAVPRLWGRLLANMPSRIATTPTSETGSAGVSPAGVHSPLAQVLSAQALSARQRGSFDHSPARHSPHTPQAAPPPPEDPYGTILRLVVVTSPALQAELAAEVLRAVPNKQPSSSEISRHPNDSPRKPVRRSLPDPPYILAELTEITDASGKDISLTIATRYILLAAIPGASLASMDVEGPDGLNWWKAAPASGVGLDGEQSSKESGLVECDGITRRWLQAKLEVELMRRMISRREAMGWLQQYGEMADG